MANGMGDLQKGERYGVVHILLHAIAELVSRYCNMDYVMSSTLTLAQQIMPLVLAYNIACQWGYEFFDRLQEYPPHL